MKKKKCYSVKQLKEFADDIAATEYRSFYLSVCKRNRDWLYKRYGSNL